MHLLLNEKSLTNSFILQAILVSGTSPRRMITKPVSDGYNLSECIEEGGLKLYPMTKVIG
jgi:hypothetical protein